MLHLVHKKGDPTRLDGRVTVYATIDIDPEDLLSMKHPIASAVHNGFLVAQGNFRDQNNLRDFLKSELGSSINELGDGLSELVDRMSGIESALDPQKLKDRLENMGDFEEFIPTPAKVVPFHSEMEILSQDGDVFYTGSFKNIGNAVLSVNAVPIVYQARYREQEMQFVRNEIESLITQIEQSGVDDTDTSNKAATTTHQDLEERLLKEFIPEMLYSKKEKTAFLHAQEQLRMFLHGYRFPGDIQAIIDLIAAKETLHDREFMLLELYAKKIGAVSREDFSAAEKYSLSIQQIDNGDDHGTAAKT
jgi:hypothetical protein